MKKVTSYKWIVDKDKFAEDLHERRKLAKLSLNDVGRVIDCSGSHISNIERKRWHQASLRLDDVAELCNLFDLDLRDYFAVVPARR